MPAPPTNEAVRTARAALAVADDQHAAGLDRFTRAVAALAEEHRLRPGSTQEAAAQVEFTEAERSLREDLRPALLTRRQELSARITEWLDGITIDAEINRLVANVPIVFLPVRVETRFDRSTPPGVLKVRIFPDEIFINTLEKRLRDEEVAAAIRYYTEADQPTTEDFQGLQQWRELVTQMSPERAAWVLRVMEPTRDQNGQIVSFPDPPRASQEWTRPSQAIVPDRWIVVTYRGAKVRRYNSAPVIEPLITGVDPTHGESDQVDVPGSNPLLKIDDGILWTIDYQRAETNGMAVTIPLEDATEAADLTGGFDRVVVFGVKTSMTPGDGGTLLQDLFDAQHYTKGLGLVPQGTPTNNTENAPTPVPRDAQSERTFLEESIGGLTSHGQVLTTTRGGDIKELATLLGFADGVFPSILPPIIPGGDSLGQNQGGFEAVRSRAMNRALWPVLLGYYLDNFVRGPNVPAIPYDDARRYFVANVRARGPASAFRTGKVPYGLLPVVALSKWGARGTTPDEQLEGKTIGVVQRLAEQWRRASENVFRIKPNLQDAYADLLRAIALHPSAREMRIRDVYGPALQFNLSQLSGTDYAKISIDAGKLSNYALNRAGLQAWASAVLTKLASNEQASQVVIDFIVPSDQLSEETSLPGGAGNYVLMLKHAPAPNIPQIPVAQILSNLPDFNGLKNTLFYKVLRHSVLTEITRIAGGIVGTQFYRVADLETYGVRSDLSVTPSGDQMLRRTDFPQSQGKPMGDYARSQPPFVDSALGDERTMEGALGVLAGTPTAELDRLFTETVDLGSHRLDAWITAFASRRAFEMRAGQTGAFPRPSHLGGYAFLENVRPGQTPSGPIETQPFSGGFVQTPSLAHATAAAILRSGYMAYKQEDPQKYAVDLSSDRVRGAREILDAVRAGTPLGEVLGQIFERRLHENAPLLNRFRYALRLRYPLNVGTMTPLAPGETADRVGAQNVVDGLKLWTAFRNGQIPWGQPDLNVTPSQRAAIEAEIKVVEEVVDRVADLVVAESVFHLGRGNTTSAVGHMDALARGTTPSEPEMSRSARIGPGVVHRVAMVFPDGTGGSAPNWPSELTPRAGVEETLDQWASRLLGDPMTVACAVTLLGPGTATSTKVVKLSDLGYDGGDGLKKLRPLDVLALAREATVANQGSTLDRWIAAAALRGETDRTVSAITYGAQGTLRTFPEVMEVARAASEVLAGARSLAPADLATSGDAIQRKADVEDAAKFSAETLQELVDAALGGLSIVRDQLVAAADVVADLLTALQAAAAYAPTLFPSLTASLDELKLARDAAVDEVKRRLADAAAVLPTNTTSAGLAEAVTEKLRIIFGRGFLSLLSFPVPGREEIRQSLEARNTLLGPGGAAEITKFLQRASQVQEGLGRWRALSLYLGVTGAPRPRIDVAQLPFTATDRWAALPLEGADAPRGKTSLLLMSDGPAAPPTGGQWRGVVLDGWVEVIPNKTEDTGVAFNFDYPIAEAAQAVLVAVPPAAGANWSYDWMLATLSETFDLARIRAVDRELLDLGQLLPTSYLARDHFANTITTLFEPYLRVRTTGTLGS
jgi:hypothetical protein